MIDPSNLPLLERLRDAITLDKIGDRDGAAQAFDDALSLPGDAKLKAHGHTLAGGLHLRRRDAFTAQRHFEAAIALDSDNALANHLAAVHLSDELGELRRALAHHEAASRLDPRSSLYCVAALAVRHRLFVWDHDDIWLDQARHLLQTGTGAARPFDVAMIDVEPAIACANARTFGQLSDGANPGFRPRPKPPGAPMTIGYVSADFKHHPTSFLLARTLELHDRDRFRVIGYAINRSDDSPIRARIDHAVDAMIDLTPLSDDEAVARIRDDGVDLLIDLAAMMSGSRMAIGSARPAPVQAAYLVFPGTTGLPWSDYAIVDPIVAPPGSDGTFTETLVRVTCYQCNDDRPDIAPVAGSRRDHGLPEDALVLSAMHQSGKIKREMADLWFEIMAEAPRSVLWVMEPKDATAKQSICGRAASAGLDPGRILFAPIMRHEHHLARLTHADLLLDTRPYGAHTTASDALWMGVPVVTWPTGSFAGRVGASLLTAVGLPELIVDTRQGYKDLVLDLLHAPDRLRALRSYLLTQGRRSRLFDAAAHTRQLEAAYVHMIERSRAGLPPAPLDLS